MDQPRRILLSGFLPHLSEVLDSMQTLAKSMECVDQCDDFRTLQEVLIRVVTNHDQSEFFTTESSYETMGDALKGFVVYFKQDLESRSHASGLDFSPQTTLVTTDTVHDPGHVAEVLFEFLLQDLWCGSAMRHNWM